MRPQRRAAGGEIPAEGAALDLLDDADQHRAVEDVGQTDEARALVGGELRDDLLGGVDRVGHLERELAG